MGIATKKTASVASITVTPSTGGAVTVGSILSFSPIYDPELIEEKYSDSRQKVYYLGGEDAGCTIVCKDLALYAACKKGTVITSVAASVKGPIASDGTGSTSAVATFSLTGGVVTEAVALEVGADGTPSEVSVTIKIARDATTGEDGTCSFTVE